MIARMSKVQVLGPRRLLPAALRFLQGQGVMQLRMPREGLDRRDPGGAPLLRPIPLSSEAAEAHESLASTAERVERLLAALPLARGAGPPEVLPDVASPAFGPRLDAVTAELRSLEERRSALAEEREVVARYGKLLLALAPLRPALPGGGEPHTLGLVVHPDPEALKLLEGEVGRITGGLFSLESRPVDPEHLGVLLTVPREAAGEIGALLFERGVEELKLPAAYAGRPLVRILSLLLERERHLPQEAAEIDAALAGLSARVAGPLRRASRTAHDRRERILAAAQCGQTGHAFVVSGWVRADRLRGLQEAAARAFRGRLSVAGHPLAPGDEAEAPVVLENPPWLRPFERLLALVPMPRYGSIDPTPYLAFFFPLFFGLMLGDAAFGIAAGAVALLARRRGWGGALGRDLSWVALACAVSSTAFGLLFGEALGGLGAALGMRPLLMHRSRALMAFLALSLAVGAGHVLLGMALGVAEAVRGRHLRETVTRVARPGMLVASGAAIASGADLLPRAVLLPSLAALAALLLVAVATGGFLALLELVLALGNVMSYARLMALGLASVMLAEVANGMSTAVQPPAAGLALAVLLHGVNFTLGLVSPTVAALRLHYVEFFEKFYEGGGRPFRPFAHES